MSAPVRHSSTLAHFQARVARNHASRPLAVTTLLIAVAALLAMLPRPAQAQDPDARYAARFTAGYTKIFLDEPGQFAAGGSLRIALTRRLGIEPELLYTEGSNYRQWSVVPNVVLELSEPGRRVATYLIGGVGYVATYDKGINYTASELDISGGIGVRIFLTERLFVSPEVRVGDHDFPRIVASLGYCF